MSILQLFNPETTRLSDTKLNKKIEISSFLFSPTLVVNGLPQSGSVMTRIWTHGIKHLLPRKFSPKSVLLLGFGGGSNARLVNHFYPKAKITAIEHDPDIIPIAKKYFGANKIKNMDLVIADALDFSLSLTDQHFDLVIVDCFDGPEIPKKLERLDFFQNLKDHADYVLINRLYYLHNRKNTDRFLASLQGSFFTISSFTGSNLVISLV